MQEVKSGKEGMVERGRGSVWSQIHGVEIQALPEKVAIP